MSRLLNFLSGRPSDGHQMRESRGGVDFFGPGILSMISRKYQPAESYTWRTYIEKLSQPAFLIDPHFRITLANRAADEVFGEANGGLVGKKCHTIFHETAKPLKECPMKRILSGNGRHGAEIEVKTPCGLFMVSCVPLFDGGRRLTGMVHVATNISARREMEEALEEARAQMEDLVHKTPLVPIRGVGQDGTILHWNRFCETSYGYDAGEAVGKKVQDLILGEEERDRFTLLLERIWRTGRAGDPGKWSVKSADGTRMVVCSTVVPVKQKGRVEEVFFLDVDAAGERQKGFASERYRTAFENCSDGVAVLSGCEYLYVNGRFLEIFGYRDVSEVIGKPIGTFVHHEETDNTLESITLTEKASLPDRREFKGVRKDGSTIFIEVSSTHITFQGEDATLCYFRDISDRKKIDEALRESAQRYEHIIDKSQAGVYIIQDGLFRYVNRKFCDIFGYEDKEIVNRRGPLDFVFEEDRPLVKATMENRPAVSETPVEYDFRARRKDGEIILVRVMGSVFSYRGRPATGGTVLDVTKETSLEQQLFQVQKMETIGQFAGGIAHDFNNILTTIGGYSGLLLAHLNENSYLKEYAEHIIACSKRAAQLTRSLLMFSRKEMPEMKVQKINGLIAGTEKLLRRLLPEDTHLVIDPAHDDPSILADSTQVLQVLMNLVTNARDAMVKGGTIAISLKTVDFDAAFAAQHGFGEKGRYIRIAVSDTGLGIDPDVRGKVFEPFFTTKRPGSGTGLGLAIAYSIIKRHGGYIELDSEVGRGTTVNVYFPVLECESEAVHEETAPTKGGQETILLAEDDPGVRALTEEILESEGYRVIAARDGEHALELFEACRGVINLVILDVVMPGKNGKEVYDAMAAIKPDVKVLYVSGYTPEIVNDRGITYCSSNYLSKPVGPTELLVKIREILDEVQ